MDIQIGDKILFRSATRWSSRKAIRVVRGFGVTGDPIVHYGGWSDFVVFKHEVITVYPGDNRDLMNKDGTP